jgi:hypothetical protein
VQNCGGTNVAATIDASKAITVAADGTFAASVDATGTGTKFVKATVTKNGNAVRIPSSAHPMNCS